MVDVKETEVCELLTMIVRSLVDEPESVEIVPLAAEGSTTLKVMVSPSDLGKLIGVHGRTARALRTIIAANAKRLQRRFSVDISERV